MKIPSLADLKREWRNAVPVVLVLAGIVLIVYVGAQYAEMYLAQRRLAREWAAQQMQAKTSAPASSPKPADDGLVRLEIPKISLDSVVVEGTTHKALLLGPGHIESTPEPGESGNAVISGHRDTFFRHIHELEKGDTVLVRRAGQTYRYEVTDKKVVPPEDVSVLEPTRDTELTLITCYPTYYIGPAPKRLVVFTRLIGNGSGEQTAAESTAPAASAAAGH
ncbi:MAG TPA: class D sortase [Terriglobales bacterium]|nr:class D sortase [Terriglobales bacterium]